MEFWKGVTIILFLAICSIFTISLVLVWLTFRIITATTLSLCVSSFSSQPWPASLPALLCSLAFTSTLLPAVLSPHDTFSP